MEQIDYAKMQNILNDDLIVEKIYECNNVELFQAIFNEKGISLDNDDARSIYNILREKLENEELSEEELEMVDGGAVDPFTGALVVLAALYIYHKIKNRGYAPTRGRVRRR